jgi:hypothetical protein
MEDLITQFPLIRQGPHIKWHLEYLFTASPIIVFLVNVFNTMYIFKVKYCKYDLCLTQTVNNLCKI